MGMSLNLSMSLNLGLGLGLSLGKFSREVSASLDLLFTLLMLTVRDSVAEHGKKIAFVNTLEPLTITEY